MKEFKFVLFDSEYTAWEGSFERGWSKQWEHKEIIRISASLIKFENKIYVEDEMNIFVKPSINKTLSEYITKLTTISQIDVDEKGLTFVDALNNFKDFSERGSMGIYCWGADEKAFRETCVLNNLNFSNYFAKFNDVRDVFERAGINVRNYQSGDVYKSVAIEMNAHHQHDASCDVKSMILTLQHLQETNKVNQNMFKDCLWSYLAE